LRIPAPNFCSSRFDATEHGPSTPVVAVSVCETRWIVETRYGLAECDKWNTFRNWGRPRAPIARRLWQQLHKFTYKYLVVPYFERTCRINVLPTDPSRNIYSGPVAYSSNFLNSRTKRIKKTDI